MATLSQFRCAVDGLEALAALRAAPLPLGIRAGMERRAFHRDIYLDTPDRSLASRGAACRLRITADDRRLLCLILRGSGTPERWEEEVPDVDPRRALDGGTEPARRLRGLVDPALLRPRIDIETERWERPGLAGLFRQRPRFLFLYDACTVRHGGLARTFEELQVRRVASGGPHLDAIAAALTREHGLRPTLVPKYERAIQLAEAIAAEAGARLLSSDRSVALVALDNGAIAFERDNGGLALPVARGSGEDACRHLLRRLTGSAVGDLTLLGHVSATPDRPALEVWLARRIRSRSADAPAEVEWHSLDEALAKVGTPEIRSPETLGALAIAARANLGAERVRTPLPPAAVRTPAPDGRPDRGAPRPARFVKTDAPGDHFLNVELSQLAFHERVLELAEDPTTPLAERLRFLAIVSGNLDEFFSVRGGALKTAVASGSARRSLDGLTPAEQLDAIAARVPPLVARHRDAAETCLALAAARGQRVRRWTELTTVEREALTAWFRGELLPLLTPRAVTQAPGHPFPVIPHLTLAFAVVIRDIHTGPLHFAYLAIPNRVERLTPLPESGDLVPVVDVVRANLQAVYPGRPVEEAWLFRVTRGAELDVSEDDAGNLLQAIEEEVSRRAINAPVRLEVEPGFPEAVRELLLRELQFERRGAVVPLGDADLYELDAMADPAALRHVADRLGPTESYPAVARRAPLPARPSVFEQLDQGDILVHHPFDDFDATVGRFFEEAARDPAVAAMKLTLYRVGEGSPIVEALAEAARAGKDVSAFVEIQARFDEARNVQSVRRLEQAGAQVVYGVAGYKTHAKAALVVRQTEGGVRRYAHVATGNYNRATARFYTDVGLLTADPDIAADLGDLFNQLTGSSGPPTGEFRKLLVSPATTVPGLLHRIEREAGHARAGRGGRIRIQVNGIEDPEIVEALYRASQAGVDIDLLVRGICVVRPGVPGLSERIRVRSILGRFLEHQRIFHFGNAGQDEYLIGSADLRPRNLRRRVEVLAPVARPELRARLDAVLSALLAEPVAWQLDADGSYVRGAGEPGRTHVHARLFDPSFAIA